MSIIGNVSSMTGDEAPPRISLSADVDPRAKVGNHAVVAAHAQVREYAQVSGGCDVGRGVYVGPGVIIGRNCVLQPYAVLHEPALLEDGVFIGPSVVFTNDPYPRAISASGVHFDDDDRPRAGVTVRTGASIGAHAVCLAPITIGRWAMVAAGAVVTRNVPDYALMVGAPARRTGWVGRSGHPLAHEGDGVYVCPTTGSRYRESEGVLSAL
jgi:UDP-2-acetamido-3-amino-2,3-dideoxy-glucuronate N-acetyltransferase